MCLEKSIPVTKTISKPDSIFFYQWKYFFVCYGIHVSNYKKLLFCIHNPCQKFAKHRKRRISYNHISFAEQLENFVTSEITSALKIFPMQIININMLVTCSIFIKNKDFTMSLPFGLIKLRRLLFIWKQRHFYSIFCFLCIRSITG